jgi:arginase
MQIHLIHATWPERLSGRTWWRMPEAFRSAGMANTLARYGHDVAEFALEAEPTLRGGFVLAGQIGTAVREAEGADALPVIICGSCAIAALGAIAGLGPETGILWMDAHPDLNTPETTTSGFLEGMALAAAVGLCWRTMAREHADLDPADLRGTVLFGARDIDPPEAELLASHGVATVQSGREAAERLAGRTSVYIHVDMDVHDALRFRASSYAVPDGPSPEEVGDVLGHVAARLPVGALSFTGLEPDALDGARGAGLAGDHILALARAVESRA